MILLVMLIVITAAPVVWIFATLSSIRRNTARTVELLERAELRAPQTPEPWEPDSAKWQSLAERGNPGGESG